MKIMLRRKQSDSTKAKISQKMKEMHAQKTETEKMMTRARQSEAMKQRWAEVPKTTMDDLLDEEDE